MYNPYKWPKIHGWLGFGFWVLGSYFECRIRRLEPEVMITKRWAQQTRVICPINEPRKKPWLVGLYRGLYYPILWGL